MNFKFKRTSLERQPALIQRKRMMDKKRQLTLCGFLTAVLAAFLSPSFAFAQNRPPAADPTFVVYCYDSGRDMVTRVLTSECSGKVISEAAARDIDEHRLHQVSRMLEQQDALTTVGLRMVSLGTAFYIDPAGILLTNYHVVSGCKAMRLRNGDGKEEPATLLSTDVADDLALLHANAPLGEVALLGPENAMVRSAKVFIVGYPDQGLPPLLPLVSSGTLLRAGKNITADPMIFHADVRHGNSGGPIISVDGSVIGIVKAKVNSVNIYSASGKEVDNIGIGVPLPTILAFLKAHNVHYAASQIGATITADGEMTAPPPFVVRAECLR